LLLNKRFDSWHDTAIETFYESIKILEKEDLEMRRIRAIVCGAGVMGSGAAKVMVEKGVDIVGAIDLDPSKVGKDLGEVIGLGRLLNVNISDDADAVLSNREADIAVVCVASGMEKMFPIYVKCIENGLNVLTSAEEASYPWTIAPELASKLDRLAKTHGVTITGGGNQDALQIHLASMMTGCCISIESITGRIKNNLKYVGPELCRSEHVGETKDEFYEHAKGERGLHTFSIFRPLLESIAADLDLTVEKIEVSEEPTIDEEDIECKAFGTIVKKGLVTGKAEIIEIDTKQGIRIRGEYTGKLFRKDEVGVREWIIKGVPDLHIDYYSPDVPAVTRLAQLVNRIPDVINGEPGYITIENYPKLKFKQSPLHRYLKRQ
jgi:4-hydroxy-tetrahydrodipicolinate reductase